MIFARKKAEMTDAARALPGRASAIATASQPFRQRKPAEGAISRRVRADCRGHGLLLGGRAQVLGAARRLGDGGGQCRRLHAQPHL